MNEQLELKVFYYRTYKNRAKATYQKINDLVARKESYTSLKVKYYHELEKAQGYLQEAAEIVYFLKQNRKRTSTKTKLNMDFVTKEYRKDNPF